MLTMPEHCKRGTSTVHTVQWYKHSTNMSKISTSPVLATSNTIQVVHAQYKRASNTYVYYARRPSHHTMYCTTHAYTYSRRVVQRSGCTCRPPYTHTHTHTYTIHRSHCPSRTPYRTYTRENVAHKPSINSGRTPRPVGSTQPCPGPVRVLYTCLPHSHAQTNTHKRTRTSVHAQAPYGYCTHAYRTHTHKYTHVRSYVHGHRNPRAVRSQMGTTCDTRGTARTLSANTTPSSDRDRSRGPDHTLDQCEPCVQISPA